MFKIQTQRFGASLESTFPKAISLAKLSIDQLGDELLDHFTPWGIVPEKIELIKRNSLFDYELKLSLFQGNAEFSLSAQRLRLEFLNAVSAADKNIIVEIIAKSHEFVPLPEGTRHVAVLHSHAAFESSENFSEFFSTKNTRWEGACADAGVIAYITPLGWPERFRLAVDHSLVIQNAVFVHGTTHIPSARGKINRSLLEIVDSAFEVATAQCGLQFQPLA